MKTTFNSLWQLHVNPHDKKSHFLSPFPTISRNCELGSHLVRMCSIFCKTHNLFSISPLHPHYGVVLYSDPSCVTSLPTINSFTGNRASLYVCDLASCTQKGFVYNMSF